MRLIKMVLILMGLATTVSADEIAKLELIQRLEAYQTITANFEQRTYKDGSLSADISVGQFQIAKPLKFHWQVTDPYEQQVISDGKTLWVYDPDLEQATYQPVSDDIEQSPAMILAQPRRALADQYDVSLAENDDLTIYRLTPRAPETVFEELTLIFQQDVIDEIRVNDSLGQETVVRLDQVKYDQEISDKTFTFIAPPGIDLFEQAQ
jgi:outer membrane lipoprotein carrier protein